MSPKAKALPGASEVNGACLIKVSIWRWMSPVASVPDGDIAGPAGVAVVVAVLSAEDVQIWIVVAAVAGRGDLPLRRAEIDVARAENARGGRERQARGVVGIGGTAVERGDWNGGVVVDDR